MEKFNKNISILFLGKENDEHCKKALAFIKKNFCNVSFYFGKWGDPMPNDIKSWEGDYIISYLSRWVLPEKIIEKAKIAAINFHPASPSYPGIGCNNFALYENAKEYGVTCHKMSTIVDTGEIIAVKIFPVFDTDNISTLLLRTYDYLIILFYEIIEKIIKGEKLTVSNHKWKRKPFTRKEFKELFKINLDMDNNEIKKRIRATEYLNFKPFVKIGNYEFELKNT